MGGPVGFRQALVVVTPAKKPDDHVDKLGKSGYKLSNLTNKIVKRFHRARMDNGSHYG